MNTKQIVAILVVIALAGAGVIGVAYAYNTSTTNTDNNAPDAYLMINQSTAYSSSFDTNTVVFDTTHNAANIYTYAVNDVVVQATGDSATTNSVDTSASLAVDGTKLAAGNLAYADLALIAAADAKAHIYKLGQETATLEIHGMNAVPTLYMKVQASGLALPSEDANGYNYYAAVWKDSVGTGNLVAIKNISAATAAGSAVIELPAITLANTDSDNDEIYDAAEDNNADATYIVQIWVNPASSFTSSVDPLTNATFTIKIDTDSSVA